MLNAAAGLDPDRIFSKFELAPRDTVIAAVSGGSDSLALLFLLQAFLIDKAPTTKLVAVTVDHQLRLESAQEAETVAALCRAHGIEHRTMLWTGAKPDHGLPAAAREARYRLLAEAADAEGTDLVLTGHTIDDQIETVAMRKQRGDGRGLAGMAPATLYDGRVWIVRPLLGTARADLRAYLGGRGIRWIDDPTNVDRKYERVRVRSAGQASGSSAALLDIASAATERIALGKAAASLISTYARLAAPGLVTLDRAFAETANREAAIYALRILLAALGGAEQLPDVERSTALFERLGEAGHRATLSLTVLDVRRTGIFLHRERRGLPEPMAPVDGMIWDGRYRINVREDGTQIMIAPFGDENARQAKLPDTGAPESLMRAALACQPAAELAAAELTTTPLVVPWARFLPSFDLAPARAMATLLGARIPPAPPFAGHNGDEG